jgi:hypothetical protein
MKNKKKKNALFALQKSNIQLTANKNRPLKPMEFEKKGNCCAKGVDDTSVA